MRQKTFILLFLLGGFFAQAQEEKTNQFDLDIEVRPRAEYRNGYRTPLMKDEKSSGFINQRSRVSLMYERNDNLSAALRLQNVSVWGEYPITNAGNSNITVFEGWAQLKADNGLFVKFGRQALHYDDGRLLSECNWNQAARAHDAFKLGYQTEVHQLDAILAYNQDRERVSGGSYYHAYGTPYKTMQALYYKNKKSSTFTPSFMFINVGFEEGNVTLEESKLANMQTFGTHLIYSPTSDLRFIGNAFYQMGKRRYSDEKISAYMLTLRGIYNASNQVTLVAGTDILSGEEYNSPNPNSTYNAFNWLYAGNHGLYGIMDMFIASPYKAGMNLGIWDKFFGINYKPNPKLNLGLMYHYLSTGSEVYDLMGDKMKRGLGSEIDFLLDYNITKSVRLSCGYATFFGTPTLDYVKGGDHKVLQDWAFLSISVNPTVFSTRW